MTATSKPGSPRTRSSHWSPSTGTPLRSEPACGTITQTASAAPGLAAPPGDQYRSRRALHNSWAYLRAPAHPDHSSANYRTTSHTGPSSIRVAIFRRSKNPIYWLVTFEPSSGRCAERVKGAGSLVGQGFSPLRQTYRTRSHGARVPAHSTRRRLTLRYRLSHRVAREAVHRCCRQTPLSQRRGYSATSTAGSSAAASDLDTSRDARS